METQTRARRLVRGYIPRVTPKPLRIEEWLESGRQFEEQFAAWRESGIRGEALESRCREVLGMTRRAAAHRVRTARILRDLGITAADLGDIDPSKLRNIDEESLPQGHAEAVAAIRQIAAGTSSEVAEVGRRAEAPQFRRPVAIVVEGNGTSFVAVAATERRKGQPLLMDAGPFATLSAVVAFLQGASLMAGALHVEAPEQHQAALKKLVGMLDWSGRTVRFSTPPDSKPLSRKELLKMCGARGWAPPETALESPLAHRAIRLLAGIPRLAKAEPEAAASQRSDGYGGRRAK